LDGLIEEDNNESKESSSSVSLSQKDTKYKLINDLLALQFKKVSLSHNNTI
jgi:hypothetical protein